MGHDDSTRAVEEDNRGHQHEHQHACQRLIYPYAPDLFVFNGFLQALIGLDAYGNVISDSRTASLFNAGDAHGRWLGPYSDTGSWSRCSLDGPLSTLEYHELLRDFLKNLCKRAGAAVYCTTADRFTAYMAVRPPGT